MQQHAAQSESLRTAFRAIATGQAHGQICKGPRAGERHAYLLDQIAELLEFIAPDAASVHEQRCIAVARLGVLACSALARYGEGEAQMHADIADTIEAATAYVTEWRNETPFDQPSLNDACPKCKRPMEWVDGTYAAGVPGEVLACRPCEIIHVPPSNAAGLPS
jgi:hypothetical protein